MIRTRASNVIATFSCASFVGSLALTWRSCGFWHGGGAVWAALATGVPAAVSIYLRKRRVGVALALGLAAGLGAFIGVAVIVLSRCTA
jgi:hypothetical protein